MYESERKAILPLPVRRSKHGKYKADLWKKYKNAP